MSEAERLFGILQIKIVCVYTGKNYKVTVDPDDNVKSIKNSLERLWDIPASQCVLLFDGRVLDNRAIIKEIGIKGGAKLQLLMRMRVGPINIKFVHSRDSRELRAAVENTRKDLCKKYPKAIRVLAILHKNSAGHYQVMRIFDAIKDGKSVSMDEAEGPKSPPGSPPKQSSPCKLIKYRKGVSDNYPSFMFKEKKVKSKDHWAIVKSLVEERKMKLKLENLRQQLNERKTQKVFGKEEISPTKCEYRKTSEPESFHNKLLYFSEEFTYPTFMESYHDKHELTPEMKKHKNITFRVVEQTRIAKKQAMTVYSEEHALQESCRNRSYYMIIKHQEERYAVMLKLHEIKIRTEIEHLELALEEKEFSDEKIKDFVQEFLWSGDVSHKKFLDDKGLDLVGDLTNGVGNIDLIEKSDSNAECFCHTRTVFETKNPLFTGIYDESASSVFPPFSDDTTASAGPSSMAGNIQETFEESATESICEDDVALPSTSYASPTKKKKLMSTHENDMSSKNFQRRTFRRSRYPNLSPPRSVPTTEGNSGLPSKKYRGSTYRRASGIYASPSREISEKEPESSSGSSSSTIYSPASSTTGDSLLWDSDDDNLIIDIQYDPGPKNEITTASDYPYTEDLYVMENGEMVAKGENRVMSGREVVVEDREVVVEDTDMAMEDGDVELELRDLVGEDSDFKGEGRDMAVEDREVDVEDRDVDVEVRNLVGADSELEVEGRDMAVEDRDGAVVRRGTAKQIVLPPVEKVKKTKCTVCKKRLNITNVFDCRCGNLFCAQHRHAELHQCNYDYKKNGREMIARQNPLIVSEKIRKI